MFASRGSSPYGKVAPAGVTAIPASAGELHRPLGAAVEHIEADEVAAAQASVQEPAPNGARRSRKTASTAANLRFQDRAVPLHVRREARFVAQQLRRGAAG